MNPEQFETYLTSDRATRDTFLLDPANSGYLSERLGQEAFQQLHEIAERRQRVFQAEHMAAGDAENLIFVPGIMGSLLKAKVGTGVWWIDAARNRDKINLLGLAPDGEEGKDEKRHVIPCALDNSYEAFAYAAYDADGMMPVQHPYDWRKSLVKSTAALASRIEETWKTNGNKPVHLVAHSMGGLLVRATLMDHSDRLMKYLGRVVYIATPHYGSPTIAYYFREHLRGTWAMWLMGRYLDRSTLRSLWGVMDLLPAPAGIYPGTRSGNALPCLNFDCFSAPSWQLGLGKVEESNFQNALNQSKAFHQRLFQWHQDMDATLRNKMAMIVGVGHEMPFRVEIVHRQFLGDRTSVTLEREPGSADRESDGSVPVASAQLEGLAETRYVEGEHSALPNIPAVYADVFRFLRGEPMKLSTTAMGALRGHLSSDEGSTSLISYFDQSDDKDPGQRSNNRWRIEEPQKDQWQQLETDLALGRLPQFERVKLL